MTRIVLLLLFTLVTTGCASAPNPFAPYRALSATTATATAPVGKKAYRIGTVKV